MWLVHHCEPKRGFEATLTANGGQEISAWIIVYVDDILVGGPDALARATTGMIRGLWQCSEPEEVGHNKPVRFLGLDLVWLSESLLALSQENYLSDLVARYSEELEGHGRPGVPLAPFFDEDLVEESIGADQLKKTQAILGELLWASIRTRPDITYAISKLASRTTKAPHHVYKASLHVLAYLAATIDQVLTYSREDRVIDPETQRTSTLRGTVQGFGDASFAPEAKRSVQCLQVYGEGNLVAWSVSRQPFMTTSSCEAEMMALLDLGSFTQSMAFLMDELLQQKSCKELRGDNIASLAIYSGVSSHWRTRHLRIRARTFHERNLEGEMPAYHVSGEKNPADIGTKGLQGQRHWRLCQLLGLQSRVPTVKRVDGRAQGSVSLKECLVAVVLACCMQPTTGQPMTQDGGSDRALIIIVILIIISAIGVWECLRGVWMFGVTCRRCRGNPRPPPLITDVISEPDEPQPDQEDELVDQDLVPPPEPMQEEIVAPPQPPNEGIRQRRFLPVYAPEPDDEPVPTPPPPPLQRPEPQPRVRIRDFEEVRQEIRRQEAERRILDLPIHPPLVVNPTWGPSPIQPTLREIRANQLPWGGPETCVFHVPPAVYRQDFYQVDLQRGVLIRWHCRGRTRLFTPAGTRLPPPIELRVLPGDRRTVVHELTRTYFVDEGFRGDRSTRALQSEWRGRTELRINVPYLRQLQTIARAQGQ